MMSTTLDVSTLQRVCDRTDRIMSGVRPEQLNDPTPCRDWTVQELMEHIVASTDFFADAAEHGAVAQDRDWPDYAPDELVAALRRHTRRLALAFRADGVMDRPMVILAGPSSASFCIQIAISEQFVHGWDLAVATAQSLGEEDAEVAEALLQSSDYLSVNGDVRHNDPPPIGPEVEVDLSASAVDRLVAFLGRDPKLAAR
jgi:uncharacterized protein (TIGR03086 family)